MAGNQKINILKLITTLVVLLLSKFALEIPRCHHTECEPVQLVL